MDTRRVVAGKVAGQQARVKRRHVIRQLRARRIAIEEVEVLLLHKESRVVNRVGAARVGWRRIAVNTLFGSYLRLTKTHLSHAQTQNESKKQQYKSFHASLLLSSARANAKMRPPAPTSPGLLP